MPPSGEIWRDHLQWALGLSGHGAVWALAFTLTLVTLALTVLHVRTLNRRLHRAVLIGLRTAVLATLLVVLGQPTWVARADRQGTRKVVVLVDASASMATGAEGKRRWDRAVDAARALMARGGATLWAFGQHAGLVRDVRQYSPDLPATDLLGALRRVRDTVTPEGLRAVVLISDGLDNAELRTRNGADATALDAESAELVRALRVPVHGVVIDDPKPVRDVAVSALRMSQFGYARTYMPVAVDLELSGLQGEKGTLSLQLLDNGRALVTQEVPIAGLPRRTVSLEFQPLHVGTHVIEAVVAPLSDEATLSNNRAHAGLSVVRDRVRVLHLAGQPSWDTRFLRTHLRAAANVDLVSFYIMVGEGAGAYVAGEETTLIPFPAKEIFEDALSGFDAIILHDFPYGPFQLDQYMPQVARHVRGGGGLLVIGGPLALSAGGYHGTPLADLLPVQLAPPGDDGGWAEGTLQPAPTPLGASHAVAMLGRDPQQSAAAWAKHRLFGRNTGLLPREGTAMLVADAKERALLAIGEIEQGRSAVLGSASLWTWAFGADTADTSDGKPAGDVEVDARADYHRLLDQLLAWLVRDPDYELLRLEPPKQAVPAGQPVAIRVFARDGAGQPLANVPLRWERLDPAANKPDAAVARPGPSTNDRGEATLVISDLPPGAWLVVVEIDWHGRPQRAVVPVVVAQATAETAAVQPDDRLLQLLAKASGGAVWQGSAPANGVPVAPADPADPLARADLVHTDLWSRPEVLLLLLGLLGAEWILRRRWGLA